MKITGAQFVGASEEIPGGDEFHAFDPAARTVLSPSFRASDAESVDRAARLAAQAFEAFRDHSGTSRAGFLEAIAEEIEALGDGLLERAAAETGLPLPRLSGERGRTCGQLRQFAALVREGSWVDARIDRAQPDRQPVPKPDVRRMRVALGPVAVFGASNFPLAFSVAGGDTASALAAGCPVVVKAHPAHPGTSELVARAVLDAVRRTAMPDGVFSMLQGGAEVGLALVTHPAIEAVGFTGSQRAGRALFDAAAARPRPIPVFAEMGSVNPVFVLDSALEGGAEVLADGYVGSLTLGGGQFCTNPGVVVGTSGSAFEAFVRAVGERLQRCEAGVMLTEGIGANYAEGVRRLAAHGAASRVAPALADVPPAQPAFFRVDAASFLADATLAEEVFGPAGLAVVARDAAEMVALARALPGQLTATVHGSASDPMAGELLRALAAHAGRVLFGGFPTGVEVCASMQHGGPYPATTDPRFTSVGTAAIERFARPVAYQSVPDDLLPEALRDANPLGIWRQVDGVFGR